MALTKCLECGGQVSTHADACPHCGCPVVINNGTVCIIDGVEQDLAQIYKLSQKGHVGQPRGEAWQILVGGKIMEDDDFWELWEVICKTGKVPNHFNHGDQSADILAKTPTYYQPNIPKCPTCGSTRLTKQGIAGRAVSSFVFGGLSPEGRAQYVCQDCGYKW